MVFDIKGRRLRARRIPLSAVWSVRFGAPLLLLLSHSELITLICQAATVGPENRAVEGSEGGGRRRPGGGRELALREGSAVNQRPQTRNTKQREEGRKGIGRQK